MSFTDSIRTCFRKYVTFSGRASRPEFWYFVLFLLLIQTLATILNSAVFGPEVTQSFNVTINSAGEQTQSNNVSTMYNGGYIGTALSVATFLPLLAVGWRRLHDTGHAGWHCFTPLVVSAIAGAVIFFAATQVTPIDLSNIPEGSHFPTEMRMPSNIPLFIGSILIAFGSHILLLNWLVRASQNSTNKYGPNPLEVSK